MSAKQHNQHNKPSLSSAKKLRLVFLGSPACALPTLKALLASPHSIELIITQPDKPSGRGRRLQPPPVKIFAEENGLPVYQTKRIRKDEQARLLLEKIKPDVGVVVAFGQIIPPSILDIPPYGFLNVHFSLLPHYRGASPVAHALLNGEEKTGITIFRLNEKMDEGDILTRREVEILPDETAGELEARLAEIGAELLLETLAKIDEIPPQPQDHSQATYAPLLNKEDGLINWEATAREIYNRIRAFNPWPSAYTFFRGERVKLLRAKVVRFKEEPSITWQEKVNQAFSGKALSGEAPLSKALSGETSSGETPSGETPLVDAPSAQTPSDERNQKSRQETHSPEEKIIKPVNPGEIIAVEKEGLYVSCGQGTTLLLEEVQPANKKAMPAYQFSLGRRIKPGEAFDSSPNPK